MMHERQAHLALATKRTPNRHCLKCSKLETIATGQDVWPAGWTCSACGHVVEQREGISIFAPDLADTISGFDPKVFAYLARIEEKHFWFLARNELLVGLIKKYFPKASRFLELGCGNGAVLKAVAALRSWEHIVGSDLHPTGLACARARLPAGVSFAQMDGRHIPASGAFDLVGAFDVVEHIDDDEAVLRSMRACTSTGGGAIVAVPQHPALWSRSDDLAHHKRRYRRGELEAKMQRSGYRILFSSSYTATLMPVMALNRLLVRHKGDNSAVDREFEVSPFVNRLFLAVLRAEVRLTLRRLRWPFGGSRVVVARAV